MKYKFRKQRLFYVYRKSDHPVRCVVKESDFVLTPIFQKCLPRTSFNAANTLDQFSMWDAQKICTNGCETTGMGAGACGANCTNPKACTPFSEEIAKTQ